MKVGLATNAYREERFIGAFLDHVPLEHKLVLLSACPYFGGGEPDSTEAIVQSKRVPYLRRSWRTEHDQRNAGQEYFCDMDWIIVLDPDEFLLEEDWQRLLSCLKQASESAVAVYRPAHHFTYWKTGYQIDPPEPHHQIIAVRPFVRFEDRRDVAQYDSANHLPVAVHHFSWARTDAEILNKITTYGHAEDIRELCPNWYEDVWMKWTPEMKDLHPTEPVAYQRAIPCELPPELEALNLWP